MDVMTGINDIEKITAVLQAMRQYELTLSDFYGRCAEQWTGERVFWQNLAHAEIQHAENIQQMLAIILEKPEKFEWGRPFNLIALNTALAGLQQIAGRLSAGALSPESMLITARDIEQSLLESHYGEIVKTTDLGYQTLLKKILSQTQEHRNLIQGKIAQKKNPS